VFRRAAVDRDAKNPHGRSLPSVRIGRLSKFLVAFKSLWYYPDVSLFKPDSKSTKVKRRQPTMSHPTSNPRGAVWRIWDLHVHTPASYGGRYDDFINNAETSEAAVIGINDYGTLEGYDEVSKLGGIPGKVIFPVVELRMHNILVTRHQNTVHVNFHIIFDNDADLFPSIQTFLNSLECLDKNGNKELLGNVATRKDVTFDSHTVVSELKKHKLYETHALVWLPYDEYGGIDEINPVTDSNFKAALIKEAHILGSSNAKQIAFFKWEDPKFSQDQYKEWFGCRKACIKGSDAHRNDYPIGQLQNSNSEPIEKYCWIKANPTFSGLKQIVFEPDRVFIGKEPDLLKRVHENQTKFIKEVRIALMPETATSDIWFNNLNLELNSSLVAIIGNKGSGKSALTDIIALCGNTHQDPDYFSFLNREKFRKRLPENLSAKFVGSICWEDGSTQSRSLSKDPNRLEPERVRYIPQHFFEKVCSSVESEEFENELKNIVFSHTPPEKRLNKGSLDELIEHKSSLVDAQIEKIKSEISDLNRQIVALEDMGTPQYEATLRGRIKLIEDELKTHETIKPQPPELLLISTEASNEIEKELNETRGEISTLEGDIRKNTEERLKLHIDADELERAINYYEDVAQTLDQMRSPENEYVRTLKAHDISISDVLHFAVNVQPIEDAKVKVDSKIAEINELLDESKPISKPSILEGLRKSLSGALEELDRPTRLLQQYQSDLADWERKKVEIIGDEREEGSLPFLRKQHSFIQNELPTRLADARSERLTRFKALLAKKLELRSIRQELFDPVSDVVKQFPELESNYDVHLNVSLRIKDFPERFFEFVSHSRVGTFQGAEDGNRRVTELIDEATVENEAGAISFVEKILDRLAKDYRDDQSPKKVEIINQLKKGFQPSELYDFLFHLDYVVPSYNLKLGAKNLYELSPGERGTLLLIFYLLLDNDDIPLILDQPEDNLDNESIFRVLVKFIKRVKDQRQIIIVTHNPNLAIGCDAEQIIHCRIEKDNKNKVVFSSGAIEDFEINRTSINILEGSLPAFVNRDSKYIRPDELKVLTSNGSLAEGQTSNESGCEKALISQDPLLK